MMTDLRTAAQQALEALGLWATGRDMDAVELNDLIFRLEAALAEPVQDWSLLQATQESLREHMAEIQRLRAASPQRKPLTEEEIDAIPCTDGDGSDWDALVRFARAIERAHGIGVEHG